MKVSQDIQKLLELSDLSAANGEEEEEEESGGSEEALFEKTQSTILTSESLSLYEGIENLIYNLSYVKAITQKRVNMTLLQVVNNYLSPMAWVPVKVANVLKLYTSTNSPPIKFDGNMSTIRVERLTGLQLVQKVFTAVENISEFKDQADVAYLLKNFKSRRILSTQIDPKKEYFNMLITYLDNPYRASQSWLMNTGNFSFSSPFPVYSPIITDIGGKNVTKIDGYQLAFDFLVPQSAYSKIKYYQCAQRLQNWNASLTTCQRKVEVIVNKQQMKVWCICPSVSETTLLIPYNQLVVVPLTAEQLKNVFNNDTFFQYTLGNFIVGLSALFMILIMVGTILDLKKFQQIKLDIEEKEKKIAEIRVRKRRNQQADEEEEQKIEENQSEVNFNDDGPETKDIGIQTEKLVVKCNADLELKETTILLILKGIVLLSEFVSILLYFDSQTVRGIRFLVLYMKFVVLMCLSGIFYSTDSLIMPLVSIQILAEFSTLFLKITKAQLAGRGAQIAMGAFIAITILIISWIQFIHWSYGQDSSQLNNWLLFYGMALLLNIILFDPLIVIFKIIFYPWCLKQIETEQTTPIVYLIYFLITQEDLKTFYRLYK